MGEFPECMKRRGGPEDGHDGQRDERLMNGQRCHRIVGHGGSCLFDREPEFDPVWEDARPLPKPSRNHLFMPPGIKDWGKR